MLNIISHQGNANQDHDDIITSHLLGWLFSKRQKLTSLGEKVT